MELLLFGAGAGLSALGTLEEGKQAAKEGKYAQAQKYEEAKATRKAGQYESREKLKEGQRTEASQIADIGAKGSTLTGTKLLTITDIAAEYAADAKLIIFNAQTEAQRLESEGDYARYLGRSARRASRLRAATNLLGSGAKYYLATGGFGNTQKAGTSVTTKVPGSRSTYTTKYRGTGGSSTDFRRFAASAGRNF